MPDKIKNNHAGHRERLRTRFRKEGGLKNFHPHNSLELLLFYSIPRSDTNELAHELLNAFGSIKGVLDAPPSALMKINGIGENTIIHLKLIRELYNEYMTDESKTVKKISSLDEAVEYLTPRFAALTEETMFMLNLSSSKQLIKCSVVNGGVQDFAEVSVRFIVEEAMVCGSASVILAHNHPGGLCVPSRSDHTSTLHIARALRAVNIRLLDHLIVTGKEYFSMAGHPNFKDCFDDLKE